jgi:hypothetical protein
VRPDAEGDLERIDLVWPRERSRADVQRRRGAQAGRVTGTRALFWLYVVIGVGGIVLYSVIGLAHH